MKIRAMRPPAALIGTQRYGLYHLTNGGATTWHDFAAAIFDLAGVAADLNGRLADHPVQCQAQQVWVMVGDGQSWSVRDRFELRALQHH